jgi:hypothetical protein
MSTKEPSVMRPSLPDGYGIPENNEGLLPWSFVQERMREAKNYWICTASRAGKPAATPVWGVWIDDRLYFDGSPATRRGRNIRANSWVNVHLESGDVVVSINGQALILDGPPERALAERVSAEYTRKYGSLGYSPSPTSWDQGGLFVFSPHTALGWSTFPTDMTRWQIS